MPAGANRPIYLAYTTTGHSTTRRCGHQGGAALSQLPQYELGSTLWVSYRFTVPRYLNSPFLQAHGEPIARGTTSRHDLSPAEHSVPKVPSSTCSLFCVLGGGGPPHGLSALRAGVKAMTAIDAAPIISGRLICSLVSS